MSIQTLAEFIDGLVDDGLAAVTETAQHLIVHDLQADNVRALVQQLDTLFDDYEVRDDEGTTHELTQLTEAFSPFRVSIEKPASPEGEVRYLTNTAFKLALQSEPPFSVIKVGRLRCSISTLGCAFLPWDEVVVDQPSLSTGDPNLIVRDLRREDRLPLSLAPWLLVEPEMWKPDCPAASLWADAAARRLIRMLADEISPDGRAQYFGNSSRVAVDSSRLLSNTDYCLSDSSFIALQTTALWIVEEPKQMAMRHALFSGEIARIAVFHQDVVQLLEDNCEAAFEAAKIAYRLGLSELGGTALKLLANLRAEVADQITKSTDTTRQLILSLAAALSVGVGLIAARLSASAPQWTLMAVMVVATGYVILVGFAGWRFVHSLRANRQHWRRHLYRFLPRKHYREMVVNPTNRSIFDYKGAVFLSAFCLIIVWIGLSMTEPMQKPEGPHVDEQGETKTPAPAAPLESADQTTEDFTNNDGSEDEYSGVDDNTAENTDDGVEPDQ